MAWSDLTDDQMVSFTDAQTSGFDLNYCQNSVTSDKCMDVSDIATKYFMGAPAGYSSNQLVPKGLWSSPFYETSQFYRSWTGMTIDYNGDVYACTTFPGDIYKLNKSGTPPNFRLMQRNIMDGDIGIRGMTVTEDGYIYLCDDGGDIYKATTCDFNFLPIGGTSRDWMAMTSTTAGEVYACVNNGDIYRRVGPSDIFVGLNQTSRAWKCMTIALNGDVYAGVDGGSIYRQTYIGGNFIDLVQANRRWMAMTTAPNGDIYAVAYGGDIYRQPNGGVDFLPLNQTSRNWHAITAVSNGDIYACSHEGGIYKRTGGTGNFNLVNSNTFTGHTNIRVMAMDYNSSGEIFMATANSYGQLSLVFQNRIGGGEFLPTGQTNREWSGMTSSTSGGVWACVWNGGIYKKLDPGGVFVSLGQANRQWTAMTADNEGNVWACVYNGDIYKQTAGSGNFVAIGQTSRKWIAMATAANGTVYACTEYTGFNTSDIYQYNPGTNSFADLAVYNSWIGLAGTPDGAMWAINSGGQYYKLAGAVGNNFVYVGTTMDVDGLCSSTHPSTSGSLYAYRRDYAIIKNPKPGTTSTTQYYNTQQSATATRDNCPEGYTAGEATLTVAANTFSSSYSVPVANQLAYSYLYSNVQAYANANASCTAPTVYYNTEQSLTLARNNCPSGYIAGDATLTVAANTYSSLVSVAVANQLAIDYLYDNAQDYANTNGTCTAVYYNTQQSGTATRDNCSSGYEGSTETLIVQAGAYSSSISVQNANDKAIAYIDINVQNYANANGTCTALPVYYNTQQQLTLARNNCPEGYSGSDVTLTVAANTYSSYTSVAVANQLAIDYLYDNAQAYANANGTCTLNTPADNVTAYITFAPTGGSCTINKNGIRQIRTTSGTTFTFSAAPGDEISTTIVSPLGLGRTSIIDVYNNGYVGGNTGTVSATFTFTAVVGSGDYAIYADAFNAE